MLLDGKPPVSGRSGWAGLVTIALMLLASACLETRKCPDGQVFDASGRCIAGRDGGAAAGRDAG